MFEMMNISRCDLSNEFLCAKSPNHTILKNSHLKCYISIKNYKKIINITKGTVYYAVKKLKNVFHNF